MKVLFKRSWVREVHGGAVFPKFCTKPIVHNGSVFYGGLERALDLRLEVVVLSSREPWEDIDQVWSSWTRERGGLVLGPGLDEQGGLTKLLRSLGVNWPTQADVPRAGRALDRVKAVGHVDPTGYRAYMAQQLSPHRAVQWGHDNGLWMLATEHPELRRSTRVVDNVRRGVLTL